MKIGIEAYILEGNRTGVGRVLINILRQWDDFDLPLDIEFILYFKEEIPNDLGLKKSNFKYKLLKKPLGIKSNALYRHYSLYLEATKDKLDILFCPDYVSPIFYFKKTALILHDISYEAMPEIYNWPSIWDKILLKKFSKISAKRAKYIFVVSEYTKKEVLKYYKVDEKKIFVMPLSVDESFRIIDDQIKIEDFKKRYKIKDKLICYVGSIVNRRHLDNIIKAFEKITIKMPEYQFIISGKNHTSPFIDIDGLTKDVNQKLNREAILKIDFIKDKDLPMLYNISDLTIYLSEYEGFGLPVLESVACGTPVITSPVTSIPEVIGEAGIYVNNPNDIDEIYKKIYIGLTDKKLRNDLINKGLKQVKKFSWQKTAQKYLDVLTSNRVEY